jgi:hypothetical protein
MVRKVLTPILLALLLAIPVPSQETSHKVSGTPAHPSFPDRNLMQEIMKRVGDVGSPRGDEVLQSIS